MYRHFYRFLSWEQSSYHFLPSQPHSGVVRSKSPLCPPCNASIPRVPNQRIFLAVPKGRISAESPSNAEYPCNSIPSRRVSLRECPTAAYPGSGQLPISLQAPAKYPRGARLQSILAVPKRRLSQQCPTA